MVGTGLLTVRRGNEQMVKYSTAPHKEPDLTKQKRKADLWCPYCGEWRKYKADGCGYKRCPVCTISTEDFWVKMANKGGDRC
jgi:hypothetical protein